MIFIEGGEFEKGTHEETIGNPLEKSSIPDFYVGKFEITNAQFRAFVAADGYDLEKYWSKDHSPKSVRRPNERNAT